MLPLAREGRSSVLLTAAAAVAAFLAVGWWASLPLLALAGLLVFVFRDFPRHVPSLPLAAVSPVDGRVDRIGLAHDPYLQRNSLRIRFRQSLWGEFNIHSPTEGRVVQVWTPGRSDASAEKARDLAIHIQTDEQDDVVVAVDAASPFSYYRCEVYSGERIGQGRRCGIVGFGRRFDLYLPQATRLNVEQGARVRAGRDVIANLVHV